MAEEPESVPEAWSEHMSKMVEMAESKIRKFETGATRDAEVGKLDYEGFISPIVLERYAEYLDKHRIQSDGKLRDSDNWQKGIPEQVYAKSAIRHTIDFWKAIRGFVVRDRKTSKVTDIEDLACAILFNVMGWLFERIKRRI